MTLTKKQVKTIITFLSIKDDAEKMLKNPAVIEEVASGKIEELKIEEVEKVDTEKIKALDDNNELKKSCYISQLNTFKALKAIKDLGLEKKYLIKSKKIVKK